MLLNSNVVANSKIEKIIIDPESPSPLSIVNFTVVMENNTKYDDVRLIFQECAEELCFFPRLNQSMTLVDNNTYFDQATLTIDKATQFKYSINCMVNGAWNSTETYYVNLSNVLDDYQTENTPRQSTPGFEIALFLISIFLYFGKKPLRNQEK